VVICLERGADLHMAQLMPLPLTVSCSGEIQIGFTFLVPAHLGSPGQRAIKRTRARARARVRVRARVRACVRACVVHYVLYMYECCTHTDWMTDLVNIAASGADTEISLN